MTEKVLIAIKLFDDNSANNSLIQFCKPKLLYRMISDDLS